MTKETVSISKIYRIWPLGVIFFVWLIFSMPYFFRGLVPFPSKYLVTFFPPWNASYGMPVKNNAMPDVITQVYPWKYFTIETWKQGIMPLWNPYSFSGTPHAANYQSAVFSPMNVLFFVFSFIDAWSLMILLQPLVAAVFMYIFLRSFTLSQVSSLLGSLSFMFCGFLVVWMAYGTLGYAILFLPLLLWGIKKYCDTKKAFFGIVISTSLVFSFFSGHFQISLYLLSAGALFACFQIWQEKKRNIFYGIFIFFILGMGMASVQLLPSFEAFRNSVRVSSFGSGEVIPWKYLITIIAPDFYGNPVTRNDWYGHYAEWASYIGVIPLLFGFYGIGKKKKACELFFWTLAAVSLLFATPSPLSGLLYILKVPVLATSAASRIIVLTSFSLAVLCAFGFEYVLRDWYIKNRGYPFKYAIVLVLLTAFIWIILFSKPFPGEKSIIAIRNFVLPTMLIFVGLVGIIAGLLSKRLYKLLKVVFIFLVAFEMIRFASKWMPFEPREFLYPNTKTISYIQQIFGHDRVFGNFGNEVATYFRIPSIEGYDAVYQERYGELVAYAEKGMMQKPSRSVVSIDKHGVFTETLLQLLGVGYQLHRLSDGRNIWAYPIWNFTHYASVYRDEHYEIYKNEKALPRVFLASAYKLESDKHKIIDTLFNETLDFRNTVILEEEPEVKPQQGYGEVSIHQYLPTGVTLEVKNEVPKILFLSDVFEEGWKAFVDNKEAPLYRANYAFRAVPIPKGEHTVQFVYWPRSFRYGVVVSFFSIVLLFYIVLKRPYENRNI